MTRANLAPEDVETSRETEKPATGIDLRRYFRMHFNMPAILYRGGVRYAVRLRDISIGGAGLESVGDLRIGETVSIMVGEAIRLNGIVMWCEDGRAGIQFHVLN